jgi:hypothetical protein
MKNIHVLPTEKPSRLWLNDITNKIELSHSSDLYCAVNIYITSDEEIKEREWCTDGIYLIQATPKLVDAQGLFDRRDWRKIILTTDQDLIKDGVQAIDDEFLEFFVKNPSCESVEVDEYPRFDLGKGEYKIIIPKEEPKQETLENIKQFEDCIRTLDEKIARQEALEEASDRAYNCGLFSTKTAFIAGAKWQQEQDKKMYSEEDMKEAFRVGFNVGYNDEESPSYLTFEEWIKEYKKK